MKFISAAFVLFLAAFSQPGQAQLEESDDEVETFRVVSWNISGDSHVTNMVEFRAMMQHMRPDVLVMDEVIPSTTALQLQEILAGIDPLDDSPWNVDFGASGGRQRGVIASRWPLERAFAFSGVIAYPDEPRQRIGAQMTEQDHQWNRYSMDGGIPVNGAIVQVNEHQLLVVSVDLQCCGGTADDWQEYRRQIEAKVVRELTTLELSTRKVDGAIVVGDLNSVGTLFPVDILTGPDKAPHLQFTIAEILHLDEQSDWTWDGRGTAFPSSILDYQLYSPAGLEIQSSYVFDTEDLDATTLNALGLSIDSSNELSRHRPLVSDYYWR